MSVTAVIYHYFEKNGSYRDNFVFFLSQAWRAEVEFIVLIAGAYHVDLPQRPNIRYVFTPNLGHDFAGYCQLVEAGMLDRYDRLIFVNCTVRGPFLPPYAAGLGWVAPLLNLLRGDVHLAGATINILHPDRPAHLLYQARYPQAAQPYSHVQSSVHAMTAECFRLLRDAGFYDPRAMDKDSAVAEFEIRMSSLVRAHGWNIACLLPPYDRIDYRLPHHDINPNTTTGHPQARGAYFGQTLHPFEAIFLKTGWNILSPRELAFHTLMALRQPALTGPDWPEAQGLVDRLTVQHPGLAAV